MRANKIFNAFLIIVASTILFLLPLTESVVSFLTDRQEDTFSVPTTVGQTTENITLSELLYESDLTSFTALSDLASDVLSWSSYNATGNHVLLSGLTGNTTRTVTATYDIDAMGGNTAIITLANNLPYIWLILCFAFAPAALAALFLGRD